MVASTVTAHPFHISTAELEYNPRSNCFEVGLKLQATDLDQALKRLSGKPLNIEKSNSDEVIVRYLSENFYFAVKESAESNVSRGISEPRDSASEDTASEDTASEDTASEDSASDRTSLLALPPPPKDSVKLIGKEFETSWVWLYFEIKVPALDRPWVLVNRVLMDVNSGQINTCTIRFNGRRQALKMTMARPTFEFDRQWLQVASPK